MLSPRSTNLPSRAKSTMKTMKSNEKRKEQTTNNDKIDDKWRPNPTITEPGPTGETYVTGKKLGKGGFAVCFEGKLDNTSEVFALKVVKSFVEQKKQLEKVSLLSEFIESSADILT